MNPAEAPGVYPEPIQEIDMAFFSKTQAGTPTPTTGEYLPTSQEAAPSGWRGQANAVVDRATQVYKQNPKLIGGLALVGLAGLLVRMKQGR